MRFSTALGSYTFGSSFIVVLLSSLGRKRNSPQANQLRANTGTIGQTACGIRRIFCAGNALLGLEIHKVFPRPRAFFQRKISHRLLLPACPMVPHHPRYHLNSPPRRGAQRSVTEAPVGGWRQSPHLRGSGTTFQRFTSKPRTLRLLSGTIRAYFFPSTPFGGIICGFSPFVKAFFHFLAQV